MGVGQLAWAWAWAWAWLGRGRGLGVGVDVCMRRVRVRAACGVRREACVGVGLAWLGCGVCGCVRRVL